MVNPREFARTYNDLQRDTSERDALQYLTKALGMPANHKKQLEVVRSERGDLTIGTWHEAFPSFPFLVVVRPSTKTKELSGWHQLLGSKKGFKAVNTFLDWIDSSSHFAGERVTAVLLKLPHIADWAVVHNAGMSENGESVAIRIPVPGRGRITLERLDSFLSDWREPIQEYFQSAVDLTR